MDSEDRQYITSQLSDSPDDKEIARVARLLVWFRAERDVRKIADEIVTSKRGAELARSLYFYRLAGPLPKARLVEKGKGPGDSDLWTQEPRQTYKVKVIDIPAFAKEHGLNAKALEDVAEARIAETKGWIAAPGLMGTYEMTKIWHPPFPVEPPLLLRDPVTRNWMHPLEPAVIDWTPGL
jgi:hypothetical protein